MALTTLDPKIVNKLFLAKMVEYVHSGELGRDYEEAKKAEEKFGRMRAPQVFVTKDGMSACEDVAEKVVEISSAHREELQNARPSLEEKPRITTAQELKNSPTAIDDGKVDWVELELRKIWKEVYRHDPMAGEAAFRQFWGW
ncbi:hypothetical protein LTR56_002092 [Elasticomyces elasticus]|nr:hypothetical protein LTR22_012234 [Elasticomyces elasticus]KAK3658235.1 hypothetical protein LTR56_002092 [Elasticomyces elasticus]KAK4919514.1 hypothetical protein LTR49_012892 [Elasticomyces elasticus]KAK5764120.1 hypothetical protein LTS12_005814 [Elasticomyces elasticus]